MQLFQCNTLGDYHDIYIKTDVLILADVFENFRILCLETYKLDPAHYFTSPGLSWDAMLKYTKVNLQLIEDVDMYLMIESGLRDGISMISNKYAKANNLYVEDYNLATCARNLWLIAALYNIDFIFSHIPGVENTVADLLSRWNNDSYQIQKLHKLVHHPIWIDT